MFQSHSCMCVWFLALSLQMHLLFAKTDSIFHRSSASLKCLFFFFHILWNSPGSFTHWNNCIFSRALMYDIYFSYFTYGRQSIPVVNREWKPEASSCSDIHLSCKHCWVGWVQAVLYHNMEACHHITAFRKKKHSFNMCDVCYKTEWQ